MNKKLLILIALLVAATVVALLVFGGGNNSETAAKNDVVANSESVENSSGDAATVQTADENKAEAKTEEENKVETPTLENSVQMGVEEGEDMGDIEDSAIVVPTQSPAPTASPAPQQPDADSLPADFSFTSLTYESYNALTANQQKQVIDMFASPDEFLRWYKAVEAQYKEEHPDIEIGGDGTVDLSK